MITLDDLIERLEVDVAAEDGTPSEAQYEQAIKDAVADFGRRAGRKKFSALTVVAGTATYDLPADFLRMIALAGMPTQNNVLNTAMGLIPLPQSGFHEDTSIVKGQIIIRPTPAYTLTREFSYKAGWALTEDDYGGYYDEMGEEEAGIVMLYAQSLAISKQVNALGGGFAYSQGDVRVDTGNQKSGLQSRADALRSEYLTAVSNYNGHYMVMG